MDIGCDDVMLSFVFFSLYFSVKLARFEQILPNLLHSKVYQKTKIQTNKQTNKQTQQKNKTKTKTKVQIENFIRLVSFKLL